jgi:hypothetical protein
MLLQQLLGLLYKGKTGLGYKNNLALQTLSASYDFSIAK